MVRWALHFLTEALCSALLLGTTTSAFFHPSGQLTQSRPITSKSNASKISSTFCAQRQPAPYMSSAREAKQDIHSGDRISTTLNEPRELVLREFCMPLQKSPGAYLSRVQLECLAEGGDTAKVVRWHVSDADEERGEAQVEAVFLVDSNEPDMDIDRA